MILKNNKRIDGCSDTVPIGSLNPTLSTTPSFGYLLCQGQLVSKITYPELYEICGTRFGPEVDDKFTLPDLRGMTIAGYKENDPIFGTLGGLIGDIATLYQPKGTNSGGVVGDHTLTAAESGLPSHGHSTYRANVPYGIPYNTDGSQTGTALASGNAIKYGETYSPVVGVNNATAKNASSGHNHPFTQPTFTGEAENISVIQPTIILNWQVKAMMLIPNQSTVVNTNSDSPINVYSSKYIGDNFYSKEEITDLLSVKDVSNKVVIDDIITIDSLKTKFTQCGNIINIVITGDLKVDVTNSGALIATTSLPINFEYWTTGRTYGSQNLFGAWIDSSDNSIRIEALNDETLTAGSRLQISFMIMI